MRTLLNACPCQQLASSIIIFDQQTNGFVSRSLGDVKFVAKRVVAAAVTRVLQEYHELLLHILGTPAESYW